VLRGVEGVLISLVAVACFLPGRAKDLSAPPCLPRKYKEIVHCKAAKSNREVERFRGKSLPPFSRFVVRR